MKLPGLIDVHVHMREPGASYKEDWNSGTSAALAGGFTLVLAMPNTNPPIVSPTSLESIQNITRTKARCDYGHFVGAGFENAPTISNVAWKTAGLKMYLDMTYGKLRLDSMTHWHDHFINWPRDCPIVVHSEGRTMAAAILFAAMYDRSVHIAHVSSKEEIITIRKAKERGIKVTCEVAPHHLFLSTNDESRVSQNGHYPGRTEVRPRIASPEDQEALWNNLNVIDCFATDHAPHTLDEKDSDAPPPGFPGLETALPLFLTAVSRGKLSLDDLVERLYTNPKRIFNLSDQSDTWIEVDPDEEFIIRSEDHYSKCGWTPFEDIRVRGRLKKVVLHGRIAFEHGQVFAEPGFGRNIK